MTARCAECRFAKFQLTPTGKFRKGKPGQCTAELPPPPDLLCVSRPQRIHKSSIWPEYVGSCDLYQPIEQPE